MGCSGGLLVATVSRQRVDDDKKGPYTPVAVSVAGLTWTEGKQYTGKEISEILSAVGFELIQVIPTFGYWSIVIGTK